MVWLVLIHLVSFLVDLLTTTRRTDHDKDRKRAELPGSGSLCRSKTLSDAVRGLRRLLVVLAQQSTQPVVPPERPLPATRLTRHRRPLVQPLMRARLIVVLDIDGEDLAQVGFADNQQVVEALPPH